MVDYPYTLSTYTGRISPLSEQEAAATGFNTKFRILYSDLTTAAAANTAGDTAATVTVTLATTPGQYYIDKGLVNITTAFAGVTSQALAVIVGTTSSTAALISSTSVFTVAALNQTVGTPIMTNLKATAAVSLTATFTNSAAGTPSTLTAGQLDIYMNIQDTTRLP